MIKITNNNKETGVKIDKITSIEMKNNTILINDIVEIFTDEIIEIKINRSGDDKMKEKAIKEHQERKMMVEKIEKTIKAYKNIEIIGISYDTVMSNITFELYDYLDKPGNFEEDIECVIHEVQPVIPTTFTVFQEICSDEYWNGEEMVESNLTCFLKIKYVGDNQ